MQILPFHLLWYNYKNFTALQKLRRVSNQFSLFPIWNVIELKRLKLEDAATIIIILHGSCMEPSIILFLQTLFIVENLINI